jgi:hypothetical protein
MFIRNGLRFNIHAAHIIDDVQYTAGHFLDPAAREELDITEIQEPERKDENFYFVQESDGAPYVVNTPKPLDQVKDYVWSKIKAHRDDLQLRGVQVNGNWFHNDVKSRSQWERMANKAQIMLGSGASDIDNYPIGGQPVPWKTMSGDYVTLTIGLIGDVTDALELQEASIFKCAAIHEATMRALTDVDAIAAYDWTTGWPEVYEDAPVVEE